MRVYRNTHRIFFVSDFRWTNLALLTVYFSIIFLFAIINHVRIRKRIWPVLTRKILTETDFCVTHSWTLHDSRINLSLSLSLPACSFKKFIYTKDLWFSYYPKCKNVSFPFIRFRLNCVLSFVKDNNNVYERYIFVIVNNVPSISNYAI